MTSCTYLVKKSEYTPCTFYPDKFLVVGNDHNAPEINIDSNYVTGNIMVLMNVNASMNYRVVLKDYMSNKFFSYKIKQCSDSAWAKTQIINEVGKRFPYEIIDTIERHKIYDMTFLDTTIFYPRIYDDPLLIGFSIYPAYELNFNQEYTSVIMGPINEAPENKGVQVTLGTVIPNEMNYNRYNIFLSREFTALPVNLSRYFEYLREEMCVEVKLSKEYTIPIKLIRLK